MGHLIGQAGQADAHGIFATLRPRTQTDTGSSLRSIKLLAGNALAVQFNIRRPGFGPFETYPELVVNTNTELAFPVSGQSL